jgi:hypothetical protein
MAKSKSAKKKPSRVAYEKEHPTVSFRLDKETKARLDKHLEAAGCSFADFVKDNLGREESMVDKRVRKLASRKIEGSKKPALDLGLYDLVQDLANWNIILWRNLPDPLQVTCPSCLFPPKLSSKEGKAVTLEMVENGDFKCPECGLRLKNPPQLAWILLVSKVVEEVRREKFLESQENEADEAAGKDESVS